ncbi:MAG: dTMP kinase [Candidatus Aenigmatarchaeota archaeon]
MSKGFFISFEGIDSTGKKTQAKLLAEYLRKKGLNVEELSFPAYNTKFGQYVSAFLRGEYGKKEDMPEIAALLFALDRYQFKKFIEDSIKDGKIIVCNRYTQSAMAFEGSLSQDKKKFIKWVGQVESRLPQPDVIILLDLPIEYSTKLLELREEKEYLKGAKKDIFEEDLVYQEKVRKTYLEMAKGKRWIVVKCFKKNGIKSVEEIHEEIVKKVENILKEKTIIK